MFQINNLYSNTNISRTIRFSAPIYDALVQAAAEEGITFNLLVLQCCHYAISHRAKNSGQDEL